MKNIKTNMGALVKEGELDGKAAYVCPAVLMTEGVHNELYYPAEELRKSALAWNGVPVRLNHPELQGTPTSANAPDLEATHLGRLFNVHYDEKTNKLKGEVWVYKDKVDSYGPAILEALETGNVMEVSTGLFVDETGNGGVWNGEPYTATAINHRPDHFAILPEDVGACSVADGAGMPRVNAMSVNDALRTLPRIVNMICNSLKSNVIAEARTPEYEETEDQDWGSADLSLAAFVDGYFKANPDAEQPEEAWETVDQLSAPAKEWIAARSLLGDPEAKTFDDLIFFPVVNPATNALNHGALQAVVSGRGAQADISDSALLSAERTARELLDKHWNKKPKANIEGVVVDEEGLIGAIAKIENISTADLYITDVAADSVKYLVKNAEGSVPCRRALKVTEDVMAVAAEATLANNEEQAGKEKAMELAERIDALIANEATAWTAADKDYLTALSEDRLAAHEAAVVEEEDEGEEDEPEVDEGTPEEQFATAEEYLENAKLPSEIAESLRENLNRDREAREEMIANAAKESAFTEDELRTWKLADLRKFAAAVEKPEQPVYGLSRPVANSEGDDENAAPRISEVCRQNKENQ